MLFAQPLWIGSSLKCTDRCLGKIKITTAVFQSLGFEVLSSSRVRFAGSFGSCAISVYLLVGEKNVQEKEKKEVEYNVCSVNVSFNIFLFQFAGFFSSKQNV